MTGSGDNPGGPASSGPPGRVPTCYRHPDRETYIRCSRCERYICPDCMTAAPVGFQCPECVAEGRKTVRTAKTALGGEIRERGDVVTKTLIAINAVVFLLGLVAGSSDLAQGWSALAENFGLVLGSATDPYQLGVADGEWYRLITAAFVHQDWWHILMNMYVLWVLGGVLEPVLGRWRFITLYTLSAFGGTTASLLGAEPYLMSFGASGAVFGLMGALLVVMRRLGGDVRGVLAILAINVVLGFVVTGIDWRAHLGGLAVGLLLGLVFAHAPRGQRTVWGVAASVVVVAGLVLAVALRV
jgi:membrane associated rhomboid family serine protease